MTDEFGYLRPLPSYEPPSSTDSPRSRGKVRMEARDGYGRAMTAAASTRPPYADASPAEIRAALIAEEAAEFDEQYAAALEEARSSYSLAQLDAVLASWRRVAAMTSVHGAEAHRRMLAQAEHTLRTGQAPAGSRPWRQVRAELGR